MTFGVRRLALTLCAALVVRLAAQPGQAAA